MFEMLRFLLLVTYFSFADSKGISCYQCSSTREPDIRGMHCLDFDWSQRYEVECPTSTFCLRKTFTVPLGNEKIQNIEMGCAPQKQDARNYNWTDRKWYKEEKVVDGIYKDGCFSAEDTGRPGRPAEYCYCSYSLCNGSNSLSKITYFVLLVNLVATKFYLWANFV